ncbi:MAG: hypothetical protein JNM43_08660 [Planctomycetaceae bacterium]|nr:hypothetical protein [Planctomycetaceae bacterium]
MSIVIPPACCPAFRLLVFHCLVVTLSEKDGRVESDRPAIESFEPSMCDVDVRCDAS